MKQRNTSLRPVLASVLIALPASAGELFVVDDDGGPGVDFATIQEAVDQANDGDGVLVRDGRYDGFSIVAKSLTIVGAPGALVQNDPFVEGVPVVEVRNLGITQRVILRGIDVDARDPATPFFTEDVPPALLVADCLGVVWIEDLALQGSNAPASLDVLQSSAVVVTRSVIEGGGPVVVPFLGNSPAGNGLEITDSTVALHGTHVYGGAGLGGGCLTLACDPAIASGHACVVWSGTLHSTGGYMLGAHGGNGDLNCSTLSYCCGGFGGDGGDGLRLMSAASSARMVDTVVDGGSAGGPGLNCSPGSSGVAIDVGAGSHVVLDGEAAEAAVQAPVPAGGPYSLALSGAESDFLLGALGTTPALLELPGLVVGPLHLGVPFNTVPVGIVPPGGLLVIPTTAPNLPGLDDFFVLYYQTLHASISGDVVLGAPTTLIVADGALL